MATMHSPEGREQAGRTYREVYEKYQKESQAGTANQFRLATRTIRRCFELIRPQNADADKESGESAETSK